MGTECPTRVRVRKRIHIPETILGSERLGRYQVRAIRDIHIQQEGKGVPKMEGRERWGRGGGKGTWGGCKDGILLSMQKRTAPCPTMDKTNGNKMLPQGKTAGGGGGGRDKSTATSIKTLMAIAWVGIQVPHKISYTEEETRYRLTSSLKERYQGTLGRSFWYRSCGR